mmetsp:Transcript_23756/g.59951  ORF Transcript_23756/g.59951 Transcript_23756/m.59951 type:complete len:82 (-) Transcript_23756:918-1163(-)
MKEARERGSLFFVSRSKLLVFVDELIRGAVVRCYLRSSFKLRQDALGQLFAEFDTPLVKAVDVPYCSLYKDSVLVHSDQLT